MDTIVLLEVVLSRASGFATREGTLVVSLTGVYTDMSCEVPAGGEAAVASLTDMFFLGDGVRWVLWREMRKRPWRGRGLWGHGRGAHVGMMARHVQTVCVQGRADRGRRH